MDMLTGELNSLALTVRATSERLEELHNRIDSQSRLTAGAPAPSQRGYEFATRLAKNGASTDDLIASCGISRHEAELLIRLNNVASPATPAQEIATSAKSPAIESLGARIEKANKANTSTFPPAAPAAKPEPKPIQRKTRFAAVG
jgi:hypothetical protein